MDTVPDDVVALELRLLDPAVRSQSAAVLALLHPDFVEFGASGRAWSADGVANAIATDDELIEVAEMTASRLASDVFLLTYRAHRGQLSTLRSSVWLRHEGQWLLRFHQGTVAGA